MAMASHQCGHFSVMDCFIDLSLFRTGLGWGVWNLVGSKQGVLYSLLLVAQEEGN